MPVIDSQFLFKVIYVLGIVVEIIIRAPYRRATRQNKITDNRMDNVERAELLILAVGYIAPLIYVLTPWLDFANYRLPDWAGWIGVAIFIAALVVFWRAHADLGVNWSPTLQMRQGHELVTRGIYARVRHPMYASQWLWVIAQPLLLQNWIAGFIGMISFLPMYVLRVPREEAMMETHFGQEYAAYKARTGAILPRLQSRDS